MGLRFRNRLSYPSVVLSTVHWRKSTQKSNKKQTVSRVSSFEPTGRAGRPLDRPTLVSTLKKYDTHPRGVEKGNFT